MIIPICIFVVINIWMLQICKSHFTLIAFRLSQLTTENRSNSYVRVNRAQGKKRGQGRGGLYMVISGFWL
jgi:hypothetical protein